MNNTIVPKLIIPLEEWPTSGRVKFTQDNKKMSSLVTGDLIHFTYRDGVVATWTYDPSVYPIDVTQLSLLNNQPKEVSPQMKTPLTENTTPEKTVKRQKVAPQTILQKMPMRTNDLLALNDTQLEKLESDAFTLWKSAHRIRLDRE
jgi:hypothetical protein